MIDPFALPPLEARRWTCHAATTVGHRSEDGGFEPLADCSVGSDYGVNYEHLAQVFAVAPELTALARRFAARGWFNKHPCADKDTAADMRAMLNLLARLEAALSRPTEAQQ